MMQTYPGPCVGCGKRDYELSMGGPAICPSCDCGIPPQRDTNVVHLAFKSPHVESDTMAFFACKVCRNKTYTLTEDRVGDFPLMRCAACGHHMGRMGWAHDDDSDRTN